MSLTRHYLIEAGWVGCKVNDYFEKKGEKVKKNIFFAISLVNQFKNHLFFCMMFKRFSTHFVYKE